MNRDRDPVFGQELEREQRPGHDDDIDSAGSTEDPVGEVRLARLRVLDVGHAATDCPMLGNISTTAHVATPAHRRR